MSYTRQPILKKSIVSYMCHICVIFIQIPMFLNEQQNKKSPINAGFTGLFIIEFLISWRTDTPYFTRFFGSFVSYRSHICAL